MIALLAGKDPLETAGRCLAAALLVGFLAWVGWGQVKGKFWAWRADVWKERAQDAAERAERDRQLYDHSDAGAANATATRTNTDAAVGATRAATEASAQRIEHEADVPGALGADLDRLPVELEEGAAAYRAAARRLQRAGARRAGAEPAP